MLGTADTVIVFEMRYFSITHILCLADSIAGKTQASYTENVLFLSPLGVICWERGKKVGALERIRTSDLPLRRGPRYPAVPPGH